MLTTSAHSPKPKITVTFSPDLVRQLDALLDSPEAGSRSRLVEKGSPPLAWGSGPKRT
jgi:hypothetical protein